MLQYYSILKEQTFKLRLKGERLKFAAAYWVPSAGAEATGGKLFSAEEMYKCDLILITLPEGW